MTSTRPYLLRAIYDWIVDNGMTPHILVEVGDAEVMVPRQFVQNGVIVLNVAPSAVRDLELGNDAVRFSARFAGTPHQVSAPIRAVQAIYARENGQGLLLAEIAEGTGAPQDGGSAAPADQPTPSRAPHLTIVK